MQMDNYWKTKDLYLAAFIYSQEIELVKVEKEGKVCWFNFGNKQKCDELQTLYWSNKGQAIPKIYSDAMRSLKDLIFAS